MKYLLTLFLHSCRIENTNKLDLYFNSAHAIFTKKFDIKISDTNKNLFDTVINRTSVDTYRKMGKIKIESDKIYKIAVNGIDTTIQIKNNHNKIFIGYKDYAIQPENIQNSTPGKENIDFEKSRHKIIVSLEN